MISNQEQDRPERAAISASDLAQIREAVSAVRAASPDSVLADLVEEKIRALEGGMPVPFTGGGLLLGWRIVPREEPGSPLRAMR